MTARHYSLLVVVGCHYFRSWVELEPQVFAHSMAIAFRCTNGDFYVALGSSMGLAFLVWIGGGLLKRVFTFLVNEPSLGQKSPILLLPRPLLRDFGSFFSFFQSNLITIVYAWRSILIATFLNILSTNTQE